MYHGNDRQLETSLERSSMKLNSPEGETEGRPSSIGGPTLMMMTTVLHRGPMKGRMNITHWVLKGPCMLLGMVQGLEGVSELSDYFLKRKMEDSDEHPASIAEYLQRGDTAIIYPEAPEEVTRLGTPEAMGQDENENDLPPGTPDDFAQLLTCPYCDRGYKRLTSLKEHIKYRHEKHEESVPCPLCSDTFMHRAQLERHMATHKPSRDQPQLMNEGAGNRKFKCTECGKAFKYKHHLKEHLRIHSGEKPYECSNCKKRFSHSGSYSSHISSKKCIGLIAINGRVRNGNSAKPGSSPNSTTSSPGSPALAQLRHKLENGRPLGPQDQQCPLDIKPEPMDFNDYRLLMASQHSFGGPGVYTNGNGRGAPPRAPCRTWEAWELDHPLLCYPGSLGNNLSEVQKVLQIVDNTVFRQKMDGNPEEITRLRAYMKELGAQMEEHKLALCSRAGFPDYTLEKVNEAKSLIDDSKRQMDIKKEKPNHSMDFSGEEKSHDNQPQFLPFSCQFCKEAFPGPIPLHQHERYLCKMNEEIKAVLQPVENGPSSRRGSMASEQQAVLLSSALSERGATSPVNPFKDHVSVLKAYFAMNTEPNSRGTFEDFHCLEEPKQPRKQSEEKGHLHLARSGPEVHHHLNRSPVSLIQQAMAYSADSNNGDALHRLSKANQFTANRQTGDKPLDPMDHLRSSTPSPLNLSSTSSKNSQSSSYTPNSLASEDNHGDAPLDLSLPKHMTSYNKRISTGEKRPRPNGFMIERNGDAHVKEQGTGPMDLAHIKKEFLGSDNNTGGNTGPSAREEHQSHFWYKSICWRSYVHIPATAWHLPSTNLHASIPSLRHYPGLDPNELPAPTWPTPMLLVAATFAEMQQRRKYQRNQVYRLWIIEREHKVSLCGWRGAGAVTAGRRGAWRWADLPKGELIDSTADYLSGLEDLTDESLLSSEDDEEGLKWYCTRVTCATKTFPEDAVPSSDTNMEQQQAAKREGTGLEPTELLMRRAYLQGLGPLGYSDLEDPQEDAAGTILRDGSEGGMRGRERDVAEAYKEATDRREASFRGMEVGEDDEGDSRSLGTQMDSTRDDARARIRHI
ncbi:LOW QUALITY PROTEIN: hypothetical protein CRUP_005320 [Coryphaenoides rupestris]|nr:LOW QUALITY PROTEIN: hypothetical protein CRUP_005320 [Coryphaenoides rupestris]